MSNDENIEDISSKGENSVNEEKKEKESEVQQWEEKFARLLDAVECNDMNSRLDAMKEFVNYDMHREMMGKKKLLDQFLPSVLAVDLALRAIVVSAACTKEKELRFVIDVVTRILCRGNIETYESLKASTERAGCKWRTGAVRENSVPQLLLASSVPDYMAEIQRVQSEQSKQMQEIEQQFQKIRAQGREE